MSSRWLVLTCVFVFVCVCRGDVTCPITNQNTGVVEDYKICQEGCCLGDCCEKFTDIRNELRKQMGLFADVELLPVHKFLIVVAVLVSTALNVAFVFIIIKCCKTDQRDFCWWV